jgi:hypothetical protein
MIRRHAQIETKLKGCDGVDEASTANITAHFEEWRRTTARKE